MKKQYKSDNDVAQHKKRKNGGNDECKQPKQTTETAAYKKRDLTSRRKWNQDVKPIKECKAWARHKNVSLFQRLWFLIWHSGFAVTPNEKS